MESVIRKDGRRRLTGMKRIAFLLAALALTMLGLAAAVAPAAHIARAGPVMSRI